MSLRFRKRLTARFFCAWIIAASAGLLFIHANPSKDIRPGGKASDDKVYLVHADHMRHDRYVSPDAQCLSGKVEFIHKGLRMFCDSAVHFQSTNSFEAFGHIRILQGDTLSLTGDHLFYDGTTQMAEVRHNVVMKHRASTLLTDSLNYDRLNDLGYFFDGGKLIDGTSTLTSRYGEYYTSTRRSSFIEDVQLVNLKKDTLISDTLNYDTRTKWADVSGPSNIRSGNSRIYTERGFYNTETQETKLFHRLARPVYFNDKGQKMTGDSLFYEKESGTMTAYNNIVYEDKKNKHILTGDYCRYNEISGEAMATQRALAKDYSNEKDTFFIHADTLRLYTYNPKTDSTYRVVHGYFHVRAYRSDVQAVCDSLVFHSKYKRLTLFRDPIVWNGERQILGEEINVFSNDSTIDSIHVDRQALLVERMDSIHYNQITGQNMYSYYEGGEIRENQANGNVRVIFYPVEKDSLILYQNYTETSKLRMFMKEKKLSKLWAPASQGRFYAVGTAPKEQTFLENFAWFDYIRPKDKHDLFQWRGKKSGTELKPSIRRNPPLQTLKKNK